MWSTADTRHNSSYTLAPWQTSMSLLIVSWLVQVLFLSCSCASLSPISISSVPESSTTWAVDVVGWTRISYELSTYIPHSETNLYQEFNGRILTLLDDTPGNSHNRRSTLPRVRRWRNFVEFTDWDLWILQPGRCTKSVSGFIQLQYKIWSKPLKFPTPLPTMNLLKLMLTDYKIFCTEPNSLTIGFCNRSSTLI